MTDILIVDDDESIATAFEHFLRYEGHDYRIASHTEEALRLIAERRPDLVFMDVRMPGRDGLQTLQELRRRYPDLYVVIMTAYGTSQTSIDAIRDGAFDYLTKPLDLDQLRAVIDRALTSQRVRDKADLRKPETSPVRLVGETQAMHDVYKLIGRLAATDVPALIVGERGTGKRLVARTIHQNSRRAGAPFVALEANGRDDDLEQVLIANAGGTVYIASIERLSAHAQDLCARTWSGDDDTERPARPRLLASSESDLREAVRSGAFSSRLFEVLSVVIVKLPPLRERANDVPLLVQSFVQRFNEELGRSISGVEELVSKDLQHELWPGNVGELERTIKRACIVARSDVITRDDITDRSAESRFDRGAVDAALLHAVRAVLHERLVDAPSDPAASPFHDIVDVVERTLVKEALAVTNGNQVKAAEVLGVNRATLRKKMAPEPPQNS